MDKVTEFKAYKKWSKISPKEKEEYLNTVYCKNCMQTSFAPGFSIREIRYGDIVIEGRCYRCGERINRVIEIETA